MSYGFTQDKMDLEVSDTRPGSNVRHISRSTGQLLCCQGLAWRPNHGSDSLWAFPRVSGRKVQGAPSWALVIRLVCRLHRARGRSQIQVFA